LCAVGTCTISGKSSLNSDADLSIERDVLKNSPLPVAALLTGIPPVILNMKAMISRYPQSSLSRTRDNRAGDCPQLFIFRPQEQAMKLLAFNGSPRKKWNTATLLKHAMDGARSKGAKTELIHLYDLEYKGCISCFSCKRIGGKSYGHCARKDDLTPVLKKAGKAGAILIGSPIYFGITTGETRSFLERLLYPYLVYDPPRSSLYGRKIRTGFIYTAGAPDEMVRERGFDRNALGTEQAMERIFGSCESLFVTDTYQFDDYSKYVSTAFDLAEKQRRRDEQFPKDCRKAYELGARLVRKEM